MAERHEEIERLLDELAPLCRPRVLCSLEREEFRPETFADEIAAPLITLRTLLGPDYRARIRPLLLYAIERRKDADKRAEVAALSALRARLEVDFLSADSQFWAQIAGNRAVETFDRARAQFVRDWAARALPPELLPDDEQSAAIASVHEHTLVTARAGSGKTRTLVNRVAFLIKHCRVAPSEVLLLAFNRSAAKEMQERLRKLVCHVPHVMTFHALAYAIVHPAEDLLYDAPPGGAKAQSRGLQLVIDEMLRAPSTETVVRQLMMHHFRADWDTLTRKGLMLPPEDGLMFRRNLSNETLRGEYVKSFGEKAIANFLFEHDIEYQYERNHWWDGRNYRPDFTIPHGRHGVVVEYFGLLGNKGYDEEAQAKRRYWSSQRDWGFVEIVTADLGANGAGLVESLALRLARLGITVKRLDDEQIWARIRDRCITRFASVARSFVSRCRKAGVSVDDLQIRIGRHRALHDAEARFLEIASELFANYLKRLTESGAEDFDGLLERAAAAVDGGSTAFDRKSGRGDLRAIRFVMIDEFQDFSPLFMRLLNAIRRHNERVQVFAVGDDWQAINGFAGSDLRFFDDFESYVSPSRRGSIATNHRSAAQVVEFGNAIMQGCGVQAKAASAATGVVLLLDLATLRPSPRECELFPGESFTPAIRRVLAKVLREGDSVGLLARQNRLSSQTGSRFAEDLDRFRKECLAGFPAEEQDRVRISTAHKFKGLEDDTVVILDAVERSFPLIHPDWVFTRVLGDDPQKLLADERRLFYVACTRAKRRLILITDDQRMSPFLQAVQPKCTQTGWEDFPFVPVADDRWIIEVGSQPGLGASPTVTVKDHLKADGFRYNGDRESRKWERTDAIPNAGIQELVESLQTRTWALRGHGLQVRIRDLDGKTLAVFNVDSGRWCSRP